MSDLRTSVVLDMAGNLSARAKRFGADLSQMSRRGTRSMNLLRRSAAATGRGLDALGNKYIAAMAGAGLAYKSARAVMDSAALDKQLIRVTQTAGATKEAAAALRAELHLMSQKTGQSLDSLLIGFNNLIQSGLSWEAAFSTIHDINNAMAVTGAGANVLSAGLSVAGEAFQFDLAKAGTATLLLDQMTIAGRLGNAELEDLSAIFARIGINAKKANLSFAETLGFAEQLSLIERSPERLATLVDSTLRLFTNQNYLDKASRATGVSFYDTDGERRAAFDVLEDIAIKYKNLETGLKRDRFIDAAFGDADLDTKKGLATLLGGDSLAGVRAMTAEIERASGTIARDLPGALENSVDQVSRLGAALREAADDFAKPINKAIEGGIGTILDDWKLGGKELLGGGVLAGAVGFGAAKFGGKYLLSKFGKAIAGATGLGGMKLPLPVYVVNSKMSLMPGEMGGGATGTSGRPGKLGRAISNRGSKLTRGLRSGGKWLGRAGGALALASTGYELYDTWSSNADTDDKVRATGGAVGGLAAGLAGGWGGAKLGAVIGTAILPGIGTAVGSVVGGGLGYLIGQFAGEWGGEKIASEFTDNEPAKADLRIEISDDRRARVTRLDQTGFGNIDVDSGPYMPGVGR